MIKPIVIIAAISFLNFAVKAEIIGDADAENGIEDNRMPLSSLPTEILTSIRSVGVIRCDGVVNGTGTIIHNKNGNAQVLTAAHVLKGKTGCFFNPYDMYMGYKIENIQYGPFDKTGKSLHQNDYALFTIKGQVDAFGAMSLGKRSKPVVKEEPALHIGYFVSMRALSASLDDCGFIKKKTNGLAHNMPDIGLDSCDSGKGASGGPVIAFTREGGLKLVGVRTGYMFLPKDDQDQAKKGDAVDAMRYANVHHILSKAMRREIKRHRALLDK